jgi:hypothetical protein
LGEQGSALAYHTEKQGDPFAVSDTVDTQGSPQQRLVAISTAHHHELPWLGHFGNLRGPQPEEMSTWHELCSGHDRRIDLPYHFG